MLTREEASYHNDRAWAEMEQARSTQCGAAAEAHVKLARLHMERLKHEDELCGGSFRQARFRG